MAALAKQLPALQRLIDAIALLDMLCSLAIVVRPSCARQVGSPSTYAHDGWLGSSLRLVHALHLQALCFCSAVLRSPITPTAGRHSRPAPVPMGMLWRQCSPWYLHTLSVS